MGKYNDNPWLGLESYQEFQIIYGRDQEIEELSLCILNNTETVLYGKSGIGKSSIINAGIIPILRANGYTPVVVRLDHSNLHSYIKQLSDIIQRKVSVSESTISKPIEQQVLWEYFHTHRFNKSTDGKSKLVIIFDQFEEIFTLQNDANAKARFFKELGDVINNVMPKGLMEESQPSTPKQPQSEVVKKESVSGFADMADLFSSLAASVSDTSSKYIEDNDIHFVFTLREDFLSEFEYHTAKIPSLRQHRYGLRPLNEEQAAEIIMRPRPGLVDEGVARLIIETITNRTDFSLGDEPEIDVDAAVLSLFLNQIYDKRASEDSPVSIELVKTFGKDIIKDFYEEAIEGLSEQQINFLEDELLTGENRRDNLSRADFKAGGFSESDLKRLINDKKILRQFHYEGDLRVEFIHDILCPVVKERKEQREIQRQQEEERRRQEAEKQRIIEEAEQRTKVIKQRNKRILIWTFASIAILFAIGYIYWYYEYKLPTQLHEKYYAGFEMVNGWPKGVNELTEAERARTPLYYKLSHIGKDTLDTDVEVCSSNSMLPTSERIENWPEICSEPNDVNGQAFNEILKKVKYLHFAANENKKIEKVELKDASDNLLMVMNYFHLNDREAWINYMSTTGQAMPIRDNGIDRVKLSWDSIGRIIFQRYYTSEGVAKSIHENKKIAGFYRTYPGNNVQEFYTLNEYGLPNLDMVYNLKRVETKGDSVITSFFKVKTFEDQTPVEVVGDHGYSKVVSFGNREMLYVPHHAGVAATSLTDFDNHGNPTKQTIEGSVNDSLPPVIVWKYKDGTGLLTEKLKFTSDNRPYGKKSDDVYKYNMEYDGQGNLISEQRTSMSGETVYSYKKTTETKNDLTVVSEILEDKIGTVYRTTIDSIRPGIKTTIYYGKGLSKVNHPVGFWESDTVSCHRVTVENTVDTRTYKYYVAEDGEVVPAKTYVNPHTYRATAFCRKEILDENGNVEKMEISDAEGNVVRRMMYFIQNGETVGRAVWGIDDKPVRCPIWEEEGFGYYKIYYSKDFANSYVFLQPFDEWMNPSVFSSEGVYFSVNSLNLQNKEIRTKVDGFELTISKPLSLPVFDKDSSISDIDMPYLHILTSESMLYKNGMRDGDRLIQIGNWRIGMNKKLFQKEWNKINEYGKSSGITLIRPDRDGYKKLSYTIEGKPSEHKKSEYHFLRLSKKEKEIYEKL